MDAAVKAPAVGARRMRGGNGRERREGWRSGQGARYARARDEMARTPRGPTEAKAVPRDASEDQGRRPEERRRLETAVVPAVNGADTAARGAAGAKA